MAGTGSLTKPEEWDAIFVVSRLEEWNAIQWHLPGAGTGSTFAVAPGGMPQDMDLSLWSGGTFRLHGVERVDDTEILTYLVTDAEGETLTRTIGIISHGRSSLREDGIGLIEGGEANDVFYALNGELEGMTVLGGGGDDFFRLGHARVSADGGSGADRIEGIGTLRGGAGDDHIVVLQSRSTVYGGDGDDRIVARQLTSEDGWVFHGGRGDDTYEFMPDSVRLGQTVSVIEAEDGGTDTLVGGTLSGFSNIEVLKVNGQVGEGNDDDNLILGNSRRNELEGRAGADTLRGFEGNDKLVGGGGADRLVGGTGNDHYVYLPGHDAKGEVVVELADEGVDTVSSSVDMTLAAHVENLTLLDRASNGTGNGAANWIMGSTRANTLEGRGGDDTIRGAGGNDEIKGGRGNDLIYGEDERGDHGRSGDDVIAGGSGNDIIYGDVKDPLQGQGRDILLGGSGADSLFGGRGQDVLEGGEGADSLFGGYGDDLYLVGSSDDVIVEGPGDGTDWVRSTVSYALPDWVDSLELMGTGSLWGRGNSRDNRLIGNAGANSLSGRSGEDTLEGGAGADRLLGGADEDILDGGAGSDWMKGGDGADQFYFDAGSDRVVDFELGEDILVFDRALWGGEVPDADQLLDMGRIVNGNARFTFDGGNVLIVAGVGDLEDLRPALYYI